MVRIYGITTESGTSEGSSKVSDSVLLATTTNSQPRRMTTDGTGAETVKNFLYFPSNTSAVIVMQIIAKTPQLYTAAWDVNVLASKGLSNNTMEIKNFFPVSAISDPEIEDFSLNIIENPSLGGISIICIGKEGYTSVNWVARISMTEV